MEGKEKTQGTAQNVNVVLPSSTGNISKSSWKFKSFSSKIKKKGGTHDEASPGFPSYTFHNDNFFGGDLQDRALLVDDITVDQSQETNTSNISNEDFIEKLSQKKGSRKFGANSSFQKLLGSGKSSSNAITRSLQKCSSFVKNSSSTVLREQQPKGISSNSIKVEAHASKESFEYSSQNSSFPATSTTALVQVNKTLDSANSLSPNRALKNTVHSLKTQSNKSRSSYAASSCSIPNETQQEKQIDTEKEKEKNYSFSVQQAEASFIPLTPALKVKLLESIRIMHNFVRQFQTFFYLNLYQHFSELRDVFGKNPLLAKQHVHETLQFVTNLLLNSPSLSSPNNELDVNDQKKYLKTNILDLVQNHFDSSKANDFVNTHKSTVKGFHRAFIHGISTMYVVQGIDQHITVDNAQIGGDIIIVDIVDVWKKWTFYPLALFQEYVNEHEKHILLTPRSKTSLEEKKKSMTRHSKFTFAERGSLNTSSMSSLRRVSDFGISTFTEAAVKDSKMFLPGDATPRRKVAFEQTEHLYQDGHTEARSPVCLPPLKPNREIGRRTPVSFEGTTKERSRFHSTYSLNAELHGRMDLPTIKENQSHANRCRSNSLLSSSSLQIREKAFQVYNKLNNASFEYFADLTSSWEFLASHRALFSSAFYKKLHSLYPEVHLCLNEEKGDSLEKYVNEALNFIGSTLSLQPCESRKAINTMGHRYAESLLSFQDDITRLYSLSDTGERSLFYLLEALGDSCINGVMEVYGQNDIEKDLQKVLEMWKIYVEYLMYEFNEGLEKRQREIRSAERENAIAPWHIVNRIDKKLSLNVSPNRLAISNLLVNAISTRPLVEFESTPVKSNPMSARRRSSRFTLAEITTLGSIDEED